MADARVVAGGRSIHVSGTVLCGANDNIEIYPFGAGGLVPAYKVELQFVRGQSDSPRGSGSVVGPKHYRLVLTDFDNPLGVSTTDPMYVANHNGHKIFILIASYTIGMGHEAHRLVHYTFFVGDPV